MVQALLIDAAKSLAFLARLLTAFAYVTFLERRLLARFQLRVGAERVGPLGLLQPLADGFKLLFKEDFVPGGADRYVYLVAPLISVVAASFMYNAMHLGPTVHLFGRAIP